MKCPICKENTELSFNKPLLTNTQIGDKKVSVLSGIRYNTCYNCKCCFTMDEIIPETHNQGSEVRNNNNINKLRLERINWYGSENIETVVDFGCGNGQFVDFASTFYDEVIGIDQYTPIQLHHIQDNSTDIINCVEVIEHLRNPQQVVEHFYRILKPNGIIYLESSFTDFLGNLANSEYVNPKIGHILIHSIKSLEMLFNKFKPTHLNNNVVIFRKI